MKKLTTILMLLVVSLSVNAQVKVLDRIVPNSVIDTYPTHTDSLGRGGLMAVDTWQKRNSIPTPRRKAGMLVRVKSLTVDSTYTLGVGLTNAEWTPFISGGAAITDLSQIPNRSYNDLQDKPSPVDISGKANLEGGNTFVANWPNTNTFKGDGTVLKTQGGSPNNFLMDYNASGESVGLFELSLQLSDEEAAGRKTWRFKGVTPNYSASAVDIDLGLPVVGGILATTTDLDGKTNRNLDNVINIPAGNFAIDSALQVSITGKITKTAPLRTHLNTKANLTGNNIFTGQLNFKHNAVDTAIVLDNTSLSLGGISPSINYRSRFNANNYYTKTYTSGNQFKIATSTNGSIWTEMFSVSPTAAFLYGGSGSNDRIATVGDLNSKSNLVGGNTFTGGFQRITDGGVVVGGNEFGKVILVDNNNDKDLELSFTYGAVSGAYGLGFRATSAYTSVFTQNNLSENREYELPNANGTLITMEQVLAMTTVQTQTFSGNSIAWVEQFVTQSPSKLKRVYINDMQGLGGEGMIFRLPAFPSAGDLVEFVCADNYILHGFGVLGELTIKDALGNDLGFTTKNTMILAYRFNGDEWVDVN